MMRRRKQRPSWDRLTTMGRLLLLLLTIGTALVALLRAIDPQWLDLWVRLVQRVLTRQDN